MPLDKGCSTRSMSRNVGQMVDNEGKPRKQAVAIAYSVLRKACNMTGSEADKMTPKEIVMKGKEKGEGKVQVTFGRDAILGESFKMGKSSLVKRALGSKPTPEMEKRIRRVVDDVTRDMKSIRPTTPLKAGKIRQVEFDGYSINFLMDIDGFGKLVREVSGGRDTEDWVNDRRGKSGVQDVFFGSGNERFDDPNEAAMDVAMNAVERAVSSKSSKWVDFNHPSVDGEKIVSSGGTPRACQVWVTVGLRDDAREYIQGGVR